MNRKDGKYIIPPEIIALAPNVPCKIERMYYRSRKNGQETGIVNEYYYVYENRNKDKENSNKSNKRKLLGKIMGGKFIPNKRGHELINEKSYQEAIKIDKEKTNNKEKENKSNEYIPQLRYMDLETKNYGEYACVLACTHDVLEGLLEVFNPEDAIRMYAMSIIYFIEEYTPAYYCGDVFKQSVLSNKWNTLSFSENIINEFLKDIGRHSRVCETYSQKLIDASSIFTAIDGHVIVSSSKKNELAEYGYKYYELHNSQINIMGVYDTENNRQLTSKALHGSLPDKISVKDIFHTFTFTNSKIFLSDSGFYSEDNIGLYLENGNNFIMPIPETSVLARIMKEKLSFQNSFVYEHVDENNNRTPRTIMCKDITVAELEEIDDARKIEAVKVKNEKARAEGSSKKYYPQFNSKSKWGNHRVIMYRDMVMHDKLAADYQSQIGIDSRHTIEKYNQLEPYFGIIVLRTSLSKEHYSDKDVYLAYKKRWRIETHYNFVANILKFEGLQTHDYYSMQGLSFLVLIVSQIKTNYVKKLKASKYPIIKHMSIKNSFSKASYVKVSKHIDNKWYANVMNKTTSLLFECMGVSVDDDLVKLNNQTL